MIDMKKEGYVAVQNNKVPLRNYLFYLTYNDRAHTINEMKEVDLSSRDIYKSTMDYNIKVSKETTRVMNKDKGEFVMSFSPELCAMVVKYKYGNKIKDFVNSFAERVSKILIENMEQKEHSVFIHEYDSNQMRVHAHVLFYPYGTVTEDFNLSNGENVKIRELKMWIEPEILEKIKVEFREYGRELYKGLEDKAPVTVEKKEGFDKKSLFELLKLSDLRSKKMDKKSISDYWSEGEIERLEMIIKLLTETQDDKTIEGSKDFSIVIDYLYDFDDKEVYDMFFNHNALHSIIKTFSVHKSNPKFSAVFLKLIHITKDNDILEIISNKTNSNKSSELLNILKEYFYKEDNRIYGKEKIRSQNQEIK